MWYSRTLLLLSYLSIWHVFAQLELDNLNQGVVPLELIEIQAGIEGLKPIVGVIHEKRATTTSTTTSKSMTLISSTIPSSSSTSASTSSKISSSLSKLSTTTSTSTSITKNVASAPSSSSSSTSTSKATTAASTCSPAYIASSMITGTGTLPKPTSFVKRSPSGLGLTLDGSPFRVTGTNIYWLCNDENIGIVNSYTDKSRIREALAIAVAMGANTIRLTSCGVSVGTSYSVEPQVGTFAPTGSAQWDVRDYAIYAASQYGLRVIFPLTDDYDFYYGSKYTFLRAENVNTGNYGNAFYTNAQVISDFEAYITHVLTHVNPYNKLAYASDPTFLAFESGNELGAYIGKEGYPPGNWTAAITKLMKQLAPNVLTIDGADGFYNYSTKAVSPGLQVGSVDFVSDHGYPRSVPLLNSQIPIAASAGKSFIIGEFDWTNSFGGDTLSSYLNTIENTASIAGDLVWSIQGHDAACCNYVAHNDGYSIYYPNGPNTPDQQANILLVVQHFYRMRGKPIPAALLGVSCPQPVF